MSKKLPDFNLNAYVAPSISGEWYKTVPYTDAKGIIKEKIVSSAENFVAIGYYLKQIWEKEQYKEDGYSTIWECAWGEFHLTQPVASRYIDICKQYSVNGDSPMLDSRFRDFNKSQLQEMLTITDKALLEQITPEMPVRQIREVKNSAKNGKVSEQNVSEQIETVPGQTTIEGDFREFMPNDTSQETEYANQEQENDSVIIMEPASVETVEASNTSVMEQNPYLDRLMQFVEDVEECIMSYFEKRINDIAINDNDKSYMDGKHDAYIEVLDMLQISHGYKKYRDE